MSENNIFQMNTKIFFIKTLNYRLVRSL